MKAHKTRHVRPVVVNSAPSSPDSLLKNVTIELNKAGANASKQKTKKNQFVVTSVNAQEHNSVETLKVMTDLLKSVSPEHTKEMDSEVFSSSTALKTFTPVLDPMMTSLNLEGLLKEEKKRILRESITQLEEEEEDDELQESMAKHAELSRRKNSTGQQKGNGDKLNSVMCEGKHSSEEGKQKTKTKVKKSESKMVNKQNGDKMADLDVENFVKGNLPDISDIQNLLNFTEEVKKDARVDKKKKSRSRDRSPTPTSDTSSESESESDEDADEVPARKKVKGGKKKSGFYARAGTSRIVSNELYAHAALEDKVGGDRDLLSLSFNLFMAGELEIIVDERMPKAEKRTRLEVLKMLAYKHEHLSREEVLNQYASFMRKVEKDKFKWGSEIHLQKFEQQLVYTLSVDAHKYEKGRQFKKLDKKFDDKKFEERKKYCLDFNRGKCRFKESHKGWLNNRQVWKLHVCKKCLVEQGTEANHTELDCPKNK